MEKEEKVFNSQRGITLIALIITIIVLLILAGITISLVVGDNGVLNQAQNAKTRTEKAEFEERAGMMLTEVYAEEIENEEEKTNEERLALLSEKMNSEEEGSVEVIAIGTEYEIADITIDDNSVKGEKIIVPSDPNKGTKTIKVITIPKPGTGTVKYYGKVQGGAYYEMELTNSGIKLKDEIKTLEEINQERLTQLPDTNEEEIIVTAKYESSDNSTIKVGKVNEKNEIELQGYKKNYGLGTGKLKVKLRNKKRGSLL